MKRVPQYGEMVPGRLKCKLDDLNVTLMDGCPLLKFSLRYGFLINRKKMTHRSWGGLRWWNRLDNIIKRASKVD